MLNFVEVARKFDFGGLLLRAELVFLAAVIIIPVFGWNHYGFLECGSGVSFDG